MQFRPLSDCVLIEQDKEKEGMIKLVNATKLFSGTIIAAGAGRPKEDGTVKPMSVKVGEKVAFGEYSGQKVTIDGKDYLMMREPDLIGVYDE